MEETNRQGASNNPAEMHEAAKPSPGEQETREPQTIGDMRKEKGREERARAPEAPAFCAGLPAVHLDPEAAALVADLEQFGRDVAPRVRELWTRVRALWNR
ncbi:hypothetical protein [Sorangium sp. So ce394]|uniref:hypothetical protein n=1 Tax=Sorangium sp. So ce394 TaxID=3133310 RepID=UPI003F5C29E5